VLCNLLEQKKTSIVALCNTTKHLEQKERQMAEKGEKRKEPAPDARVDPPLPVLLPWKIFLYLSLLLMCHVNLHPCLVCGSLRRRKALRMLECAPMRCIAKDASSTLEEKL
jgi:hypothetical protein